MFSVFHPDAHDLFNTCSDLKKVAWELHDVNRRLNDEVSRLTSLIRFHSVVRTSHVALGQSSATVPLICPHAL